MNTVTLDNPTTACFEVPWVALMMPGAGTGVTHTEYFSDANGVPGSEWLQVDLALQLSSPSATCDVLADFKTSSGAAVAFFTDIGVATTGVVTVSISDADICTSLWIGR